MTESLYLFGFVVSVILILWETKEKPLGIFLFVTTAMSVQIIGIFVFQSIFPSPTNVKALFLFDLSALGIWIGIRIWKLSHNDKDLCQNRNPDATFSWLFPESSLWYVLFSIALILILSYSFVGKFIPLLVSHSASAKVQFAMGRGIYMRLFKVFIPITAMLITAHMLTNKLSFLKKTAFVLLIGVLMIFSFSTAYKAWPAFVLIFIFLLFYYTKKRVKTFYFVGLTLLCVITALLVTYFIYGSNLSDTAFILSKRLTADQVLPVIKSVEMVEKEGTKGGLTFIWDLQYMLGTFRITERPPTVLAVYLFNRLYGKNPYSMTAPPGFVGEVFLNFGFLGLAVFSVLFGYILFSLHRTTSAAPRITRKIFYIYIMFIFFYTVFGGTIIASFEDLAISGALFLIVWITYCGLVRIADAATTMSKNTEI